jgi:predicted ArsR family transcriptional regulator
MELEMDRLAGVGNRELRTALSYALAQARPVTADDLAEAQGVHRNVARSRLERLVEAGLLASSYERRTGRAGPGAGRPAKLYAVKPHLRAIEFPDRRQDKLVGLLLDRLPARSRSARLREVGREFADDLRVEAGIRPAKTLATGARRMCAAISSLGFHATVVHVGDGVVELETPICPLRPLVRERSVAAELDRGFWSGLLAGALSGVASSRISCQTCHCDEDGPCRVILEVAGS